MSTPQRTPKYRHIYNALQQEILSGRWRRGERLPSEMELVHRFGASRITVGRAVRDLQQAGLVERRVGSGTYVAAALPASALSFGLLIPDLGETEIFEPICQGMMESPRAREHALLWGSPMSAGRSKEERAWQLCRQYIERKVAGVFFAPLELSPEMDVINRRIVQALDDAHIPIVLLDRGALPYPERTEHDLVGIDSRRAGYIVTQHLLQLGCRRLAFAGVPNAAATVAAREAGYREALYRWGCTIDPGFVHRLDPGARADVTMLMETNRPDGIVCANDRTAAHLMHTLLDLGYSVPDQVKLVGIDDLDYAALLPVPLTTLRQPTREIGAAALAAMLDRVAELNLPARDIFLNAELIVRRSCGANA